MSVYPLPFSLSKADMLWNKSTIHQPFSPGIKPSLKVFSFLFCVKEKETAVQGPTVMTKLKCL